MAEMPALESQRLLIRPFSMDDLTAVHQLLDVDLGQAQPATETAESLRRRAEWLQWSVLNYTQLARLHQPPYGDRAIILTSTADLIGACGFVPCLNRFDQLPGFTTSPSVATGRTSTEFGLFYAVAPDRRRQGFATEAAQALVDYAFRSLHLKRIVATTEYDNAASIGVMRRLGMRIEKNPPREPPWLQVVGVLEQA